MIPADPGLSSYAVSFSVGAPRYTRNTTTVLRKSWTAYSQECPYLSQRVSTQVIIFAVLRTPGDEFAIIVLSLVSAEALARFSAPSDHSQEDGLMTKR